MKKLYVLLGLAFKAIAFYIAYNIVTINHHHHADSEKHPGDLDAIEESATTPVEDYNKLAEQFKRPILYPPARTVLENLYKSNNKTLVKKFIQIKEICNSLSRERKLKYSEFCHLQHFNCSKRVPQAIIIGVMKTGTTLVTHLLNEHPFISIPLTELNFFNNNKWKDTGDLLMKYSGLMPHSLSNQLTMEKTAGYIYYPYVPERVRPLMGDNMKFIVQFRDPVKRVLSEARYYPTDIKRVYNGNIKAANETVQAEHLFYRIGDGDIQLNEMNAVFTSRYVEGLSHWLRFYSLDRFHFISYEDIIKQPLEVMKGIERFLGIPSFFDEESFHFHDRSRICYKVTKLAETGTVDALLQKMEGDSLHITSSYSCDGGIGIYPHHITEEYKKLLQDFFRPYNEKLYSLTGINFGW